MAFCDRTDELESLETAFESPGRAFSVVYRRRRVGKTVLLKELCDDYPHIYHLAAQEAEIRQREKFVEQVAETFDERVPRIGGWDDAFEYLGEKLAEEDRIIVIDEFPYLIEENDSIPSYIQAFVDEQLTDTESMLVLCGSSVSAMESEVLGHESPLYGRRTGQIDLQPFTFGAVWEMIRRGDVEQYSEVGRWWYGESEIDIVGLAPADDRLFLAECKWTGEPVGRGLVEELRTKADSVRRGSGDRSERFAVFSKSGFVDGLDDDIEDNWSLFDLDDLDRLFTDE